MSTLSRSVTIEAPAERVFAYVDDIRNLTRHPVVQTMQCGSRSISQTRLATIDTPRVRHKA
jgi:ligand-binding SRPBCC domain-containing protein